MRSHAAPWPHGTPTPTPPWHYLHTVAISAWAPLAWASRLARAHDPCGYGYSHMDPDTPDTTDIRPGTLADMSEAATPAFVSVDDPRGAEVYVAQAGEPIW